MTDPGRGPDVQPCGPLPRLVRAPALQSPRRPAQGGRSPQTGRGRSGAGAGTKEDYRDDPTAERGEQFLNTLLRQAKDLDPTRPVTLVGLMGGPTARLAETDVIYINRYWGWYVLSGQLGEARAGLTAELDRL